MHDIFSFIFFVGSRTCHEHVLISRDEEVQQIGVADAVHGRDDKLEKIEFRVMPGNGKQVTEILEHLNHTQAEYLVA